MNNLDKVHILKTQATCWDAVATGAKRFEVRRNDRFFQQGDIVRLRKLRKVTMFNKEMMDALRADAEKLEQLTSQDHTPQFLADCEVCDGKGYILRTIHVYEAGCGFSHPDVEEIPCEACDGNGWFVCEES